MIPDASLVGTPAIAENLLKRKWSVTIMRHLRSGTTDPAEIARQEEDMSPSAMSERLRTMVRYRLILRYPRPGRPKTIDYRLSPKGRRILTMLELLSQLDQLSDHDPRSLEDILRADLTFKTAPLVVLPEPGRREPIRSVPAVKKKPKTLIA